MRLPRAISWLCVLTAPNHISFSEFGKFYPFADVAPERLWGAFGGKKKPATDCLDYWTMQNAKKGFSFPDQLTTGWHG